jgi:hypothetical protein
VIRVKPYYFAAHGIFQCDIKYKSNLSPPALNSPILVSEPIWLGSCLLYIARLMPFNRYYLNVIAKGASEDEVTRIIERKWPIVRKATSFVRQLPSSE